VRDRFAGAAAVADAVLYEGYLLYPYRASACKNQFRWQFGVLTPRAFSEVDPSERSSMHTECLLDPEPTAVLHVRLRCLQVQRRSVEAIDAGSGDSDRFVPVGRLQIDQSEYMDWDEAVERCVELPPLAVEALAGRAHQERFVLAGGTESEPLFSADGTLVGRLVRRREDVAGTIRVTARPCDDRHLVVAVTVENATTLREVPAHRADVVGHSLVALHTMVAVEDGRFVSLLDPPQFAAELVVACRNDGAFPVLIGDDDEVVLSSPIILYDHPAIAPESPGDLYDATEIDEILALRVLTLTDEEKAEARQTDPRAAAIVDRCDAMAPDTWSRLHGEMRELRELRPIGELEEVPVWGEGRPSPAPWWKQEFEEDVDPWTDTVTVAGVAVAKGVAVRLRPSHRSDAQDLFLDGMTATVAGVFTDADGDQHVAVTVDDDPANEALSWQGRYLFFHPDEVEPLGATKPGAAIDAGAGR
jgi:hypothetical protein